MPNIQVDLASALVTNRYGRKFGHLVRVIGGADYITTKQIEARLNSYQGDTDIRIKKGEVEPILSLLIWHKYATFKERVFHLSYSKSFFFTKVDFLFLTKLF